MKKTIKLLTFSTFLAFTAGTALSAEVLNQVKFKTHLRWNLFLQKDQLNVLKKGTKVSLKTLNLKVFDQLKKDVAALSKSASYIKNVSINDISVEKGLVGSIEVDLAHDDVELFSFYRDADRKYVLDFWVDNDIVAAKTAAVNKKPAKKKVVKKTVKRAPKKVAKKSSSVSFKKLTKLDKTRIDNSAKFRDFRYGAPMIWDYAPLSPQMKKIVNLSRKTPEYFYPVKDRDNYESSEQEAHLQLTINLYRKKKWGLMYKSLKLFEKKYGENTEVDFNEYLKANALLRNNFGKGKTEPVKMAIGILANIGERTPNYDLKKGIYKYLLSYSINSKDFVKALDIAKRFYVASREQYDIEESVYAAEAMLHSLAQLNQISVIKELINDKIIVKLVPKQTLLSYELYTLLKMNNTTDLLKKYSSAKGSLVKPVRPAILFNAAESMFRTAKYQQAIKLYDDFLSQHSYHSFSSQARLRIAVAYEVLGKNISETVNLYKNAINKASVEPYNYEARIRYVALRNIRKIKTSPSDIETRVLLENKFASNFKYDANIKKLLWLVRLRTFIADKKFSEALTYLNAVPLNSMKPSEKRVFEADGAEVVYGIILDNYKKSDYSKVVNVWEVYKNRYVNKVATDPFMNFVVAHSYVKLGLFGGFDSVYDSFKKLAGGPVRTFPVWSDHQVASNSNEMLSELKIISNIKLKNWELARHAVARLRSINKNNNKINYYNSLIDFYNKKYASTIANVERYLAGQKEKSIYDSSDVAEMIRAYTDSLYELGQIDKFRKVSLAILADTENYAKDNEYMNKVKERISYLSIEIVAGEDKPESYFLVESMITSFLKNYKKSVYEGRLRYLLGVAYVANKKSDDGKKVFNALLEDAGISDYIKEMVRSELSLIKIKERTI